MSDFGNDTTIALAAAIMGADASIYVRGTTDLLRRSGLTEGHLLAVDRRLDLRCLLCQPTFGPLDDPFIELDIFSAGEPFPDLDQAGSRDWKMRRGDGKADRIDILLDESEWIAVHIDSSGQIECVALPGNASAAAMRFRQEWTLSDQIDLLYLERDDDLFDENEAPIAVDPKRYWDDFLAKMLACPEQMQEIGDRKFEEFVAEMLNRDGFEVRLTPQTRDGGYDVLAMRRLQALELLFLVECKRYKRSRKVGVEIVRSLYGVVCEKRANAGLIVTTSTFSKPALAATRGLGSQLALKDYHGLLEWMRRLRG
ncbi:MAG TPA: restriction endonuclease [Phycisphaerales bacterium]